MNQDITRIRKIAVISFAVTVALEVAGFFVLRDNIRGFLGILISGLLTLLFFMATLAVYLKAANAQTQNKLKYLMVIFFAKMAVSAAVFYAVFRFHFADMRYLLISFLIFFTLFLNLEIFLIYKRMLFYKR
jgi:peptidoglycan biosynthesis protein MviN/MurJ (putative lipid II flippase)